MYLKADQPPSPRAGRSSRSDRVPKPDARSGYGCVLNGAKADRLPSVGELLFSPSESHLRNALEAVLGASTNFHFGKIPVANLESVTC